MYHLYKLYKDLSRSNLEAVRVATLVTTMISVQSPQHRNSGGPHQNGADGHGPEGDPLRNGAMNPHSVNSRIGEYCIPFSVANFRSFLTKLESLISSYSLCVENSVYFIFELLFVVLQAL